MTSSVNLACGDIVKVRGEVEIVVTAANGRENAAVVRFCATGLTGSFVGTYPLTEVRDGQTHRTHFRTALAEVRLVAIGENRAAGAAYATVVADFLDDDAVARAQDQVQALSDAYIRKNPYELLEGSELAMTLDGPAVAIRRGEVVGSVTATKYTVAVQRLHRGQWRNLADVTAERSAPGTYRARKREFRIVAGVDEQLRCVSKDPGATGSAVAYDGGRAVRLLLGDGSLYQLGLLERAEQIL